MNEYEFTSESYSTLHILYLNLQPTHVTLSGQVHN